MDRLRQRSQPLKPQNIRTGRWRFLIRARSEVPFFRSGSLYFEETGGTYFLAIFREPGSDRNWEIERRERWREGGHTQVSFDFYRLLCESPNLLGNLCGHVHSTTLDIVNGKPFITTEANARGAWRLAEFKPMAK
ncbi:MAG: hypothetical protein J6J31_07135 [Thermoguttaceae bacterium]|nr:hypothetical protein [Thermoguttaceae bacterium]